LVAADNPKACAAAESVSTALTTASPTYEAALANGVTPISFDLVSAVGVNKDIHEIICNARLHFASGGFERSQQIDYKLRPSLENDNQFIVEVQKSPILVGFLAFYVERMKAEQQSDFEPAHRLTDEEMKDAQ